MVKHIEQVMELVDWAPVRKRVSYQDQEDDNADKQVLHKSLEWKQEHTINTHITKVVLN